MSVPTPIAPQREDVCEVSQPPKISKLAGPREILIKSLWVWFILIALLLTLNAIVSQAVVRELNNQRAAYLKNRALQVDFMQYLSALKDAETGQRGYLITGDEAYLATYQKGLQEVETYKKNLSTHFTAEPAQKELLANIFELTGRKLQEMSLTIDAYRRDGQKAASAIVESEQGKWLMDNIRSSVDNVIREQEKILTRIGIHSQNIRNGFYWLALVTSITGIIFLGILYIYTLKSLQQRAALLQAQRVAGERISLALEEKERAFNELTQVNKVKDEFLAIVSHELRTPLNAILGWATLLKEGASDEEYREGLQSIERNARSQSVLIEDLLDVSRVVTGKIRLHVGPVDLREIARAVAESAKPALEAKQISLEMQLPDELPLASGDADRIQQVAWNFLSNAIKFTQKGGHITLSVLQVKSSVSMIVQDNGQGISPEFLPEIFNRFTQADTSTTRGQGGLGLGLAIVKHIVELHGGSVFADSQGLGHGSIFRMEIPVIGVVDSVAKPNGASNVVEMPGGEKLTSPVTNKLPDLKDVRVFLVDDQPDTLRVLSNVLLRCGAEIHTASSAGDALESIPLAKPDVLVSDIGLPDMDGHALITKLRSTSDLALQSVPALALTAFARSEDRVNALEAGFNDHLAKPADAMEFARRVGRLAGRS